MASYTTSARKGEGNLRHNNRDIYAKNVDRERTCNNVTFVRETLEEAYEKLFGDEVRRYNIGKKPCRQINDYLEHIRNSKNGEKPFYEVIFQVGNMYDCAVGTKSGEMAKEILIEYMEKFSERNPNIYAFNAVLHMDEKTPHIHLNYIPIARDYKNGLQIRNSLDKALKQQGIDGKSNVDENSTQNWQEREKQFLGELLKERGHERAPESGIKRKYRSVENYKAECQIVSAKVKKLPTQIETAPYAFNKERVSVLKKDLEKLEKRAKLATVHDSAIKQTEKLMDEKKHEIDSIRAEIIEEYKHVHSERVKLEDAVRTYEELRESQKELNQNHTALLNVCEQQKDAIHALRTQNALLSQNIEERVESIVEAKTGVLIEQIGALTADNMAKDSKIKSLERENRGLRSSIQRIRDIAQECFKKRDFTSLKQLLFPESIQKDKKSRDDR